MSNIEAASGSSGHRPAWPTRKTPSRLEQRTTPEKLFFRGTEGDPIKGVVATPDLPSYAKLAATIFQL